jgi:hypothetical protein
MTDNRFKIENLSENVIKLGIISIMKNNNV